MNAKQLWAKLKAFPLAVSLFLAAALLSGWTYWRSTGALDDATQQHDDLDAQNSVVAKNLTEGEQIEDQFTELSANADKFAANLIDPAPLADTLNQSYFWNLERDTGVDQLVDPDHVKTIKDKDPAIPSVTTFTLAVAGTWANIIKFTNALEGGPHPLRITEYQLARASQLRNASDNERVNLTLTVEMLGK